MRKPRPELRLEVAGLGTVDPFRLKVVQQPPNTGEFCVEDPDQSGRKTPLEMAGLSLAGASQALLALSLRWMDRAGRAAQEGPGVAGEVRMVLKRREARLLAALLKRHVARLPQAPAWMPELAGSLEQIDEYLRWEET